MTRRWRWAGIAAAAVVAGPVAILLLLWLLANTSPGRAVIAWSVSPLTGGQVVTRGLTGQLPGDIKIGAAELGDTKGVWLRLSNVSLRWSPFALFSQHAAITNVSAEHAYVLRYPDYGPAHKTESKWRVDIGAATIARLELAPGLGRRKTVLTLAARGHYVSLKDMTIDLDAHELAGAGNYRLRAHSDIAQAIGDLVIREEPNGPLGALLGLPTLGALALEGHLSGPRQSEQARFALTAGALTAKAVGAVDLDHRALNVAVAIAAPQMKPRADVSWQRVDFSGHVAGSFEKPEANGRLTVDGVSAGAASFATLSANLYAHGGRAAVTADVARLRFQGPAPDLLSAAPLKLEFDAWLDQPTMPIAFVAAHPLFSVRGQGDLAQETKASFTVALPDLSPFSALVRRSIRGRAQIMTEIASNPERTEINVKGSVLDASGDAPAPLLARKSQFTAEAEVTPHAITLKNARIAGDALEGTAFGSFDGKAIALTTSFAIKDLARLPGNFIGKLRATGHLEGPINALDMVAQADGAIASRGFATSPVHAALSLSGWPSSPRGDVLLSGTLDGAPLAVSARLDRQGGQATHFVLTHASWKSVGAQGELVVAKAPSGKIEFRIGQLADLDPFLSQPLKGRFAGTLGLSSLKGRLVATIKGAGQGLTAETATAGAVGIDGSVVDPIGTPNVNAKVSISRMTIARLNGGAVLALAGPLSGLGYRLAADARDAGGSLLRVSATGFADAGQGRVVVQTLQADYKGEAAHLIAPVRVDLSKGVRVDRLQIAAGKAVLNATGAISPALDLAVSVRDLTPQLAKPFFPALDADGVFSANARLRGTLAAPEGTLNVQGSSVRFRNAIGASLPPARVTATAQLAKQAASLHAQLAAGQAANVTLSGEAPLKADGRFDLHGAGSIDTSAVFALLSASGRTMKGVLTFDGQLQGTLAEPRLRGKAGLKNGDAQDYIEGVHISNIDASLHAENDRIVLDRFSGHAGPGTITASGTIGISSKAAPLDITIAAHNARPVATDLVSAEIDANLKLGGTASSPKLKGSIDIRRGEINIAQSLPPTVATLGVRRKGQRFRAKPAPSATPLALDLTVACAGQLFVRGRGLDAEVAGDLGVQGSSAAPLVMGGFTMRRGDLNLAGQVLQFTSGKLVFDGGSPSASIDPRLDFIAQTTAQGVTATLAIGGYASAPTVKLTSAPSLPQDEILARLLFGQSAKQLGALQLAQIADAVASLGGGGGSFGNPLATLRTRLGLDRLAVGGGDNTKGLGATIEAGKYVGKGIYVGGKQSTGGATQAQVKFDITKNLKAEATISAGTPATTTPSTPLNDKGSSVGLSYEFEY